MIEILVDWIVAAINAMGYIGLFFLMALESMVAPIPSELVMPFAGFLVAQGKMNLWLVALIAALGGILGSMISYWIGEYGGRKFVLKFGKYLLLDEEHLDWTERFFKKHGEKTIFISRFIPVVRHLISIPAGLGRMHKWKFITYTFAGCFIWDFFLAWVGMQLGEHWEKISEFTKPIDMMILMIVVVAIAFFVYRLYQKKRQKR